MRRRHVIERFVRAQCIVPLGSFTNPESLSYWAYHDWRVPRLLQGSYFRNAVERPVIYPFLDERVLLVCARLAPADRVDESAFFGALVRLAPQLADVPLFDDQWRFDASGRATLFPDGFATRCVPNTGTPAPAGARRSPDRKLSTILPLARALLGERAREGDICAWLRPEVVAAILEHDEPDAVLGIENAAMVGFLWRLVAMGLLLEGSWLELPVNRPAR